RFQRIEVVFDFLKRSVGIEHGKCGETSKTSRILITELCCSLVAGAHGLPFLFGASPRKPGSRNREHGGCGSVLIHVFQVLRQNPARKSACSSERTAPLAATAGATAAATPRGGLISGVCLRSEMMMNIDPAWSAF